MVMLLQHERVTESKDDEINRRERLEGKYQHRNDLSLPGEEWTFLYTILGNIEEQWQTSVLYREMPKPYSTSFQG